MKIVSRPQGPAVGGSPYASPVDIGPAGAAHPDITLRRVPLRLRGAGTEGAVRPTAGAASTGSFARSPKPASGPGGNVYAELGSTWCNVMRDPTRPRTCSASCSPVGPDNVVWGTDSIWYGSPQAQIEAFRAFEITEEFQEQSATPRSRRR